MCIYIYTHICNIYVYTHICNIYIYIHICNIYIYIYIYILIYNYIYILIYVLYIIYHTSNVDKFHPGMMIDNAHRKTWATGLGAGPGSPGMRKLGKVMGEAMETNRKHGQTELG